jgi:hypothetical protein
MRVEEEGGLGVEPLDSAPINPSVGVLWPTVLTEPGVSTLLNERPLLGVDLVIVGRRPRTV